MKINWKEKLTSRKFWLAVTGFVTALLTAFAVQDSVIVQVVSLIGSFSTVIAYIIGEGLVDANRNKTTETETQSKTETEEIQSE